MMEPLDIFSENFFGEPETQPSRGAVSDKFVASPFTIIDARQGWWQDRKRAWVGLGIKSEEGREGMGKCMKPGALSLSDQYKQKDAEAKGLIFSRSSGTQYYYQKTAMEEKLGRKLTTAEFDPMYVPDSAADGGTSIFDPVLTECLYRWFCPAGGQIIDPFAGGSVRGIVAKKLGFEYYGSELRPEQVESNNNQAEEILGFDVPEWWCGDALVATPPPGDMLVMCHTEDTAVLTRRRGYVPISEILEGESVLSHTGEWREVTETFSRQYTGELYSFRRAYRATPIEATKEHPLLVRRFDKRKRALVSGCGYREKWIQAQFVKKGDYLIEPVPKEPSEPDDNYHLWSYTGRVKLKKSGVLKGNKEVFATKEVAVLVGYYLAEGSVCGGATSFAFNTKEIDYHKEVKTCFHNVFGKDLSVRISEFGNVSVVSCSGKIAARFFEEKGGGKGASKKRIPGWVFDCSNDIAKEVVRGLWSGDGWVCEEDGDMGFGSVSRNLAEDLSRLLLRLGIVASIRMRSGRPNGFCANPKPQWHLAVRGEYAQKLASIVGVKIKTPRHRRPGRQPFIRDGYVHYRVEKITTKKGSYQVFNLEIDKDHSYLAEGVSSHNCPPYGDLEVYSDLKEDISNMDHQKFLAAYRQIIERFCKALKNDRFACAVVGDFRDEKTGLLRRFVDQTNEAFELAGLKLYNDAILVTMVGSASLRVTKQFNSGKKLCRTHQNVQVYVKGDWKKAAAAIGGK